MALNLQGMVIQQAGLSTQKQELKNQRVRKIIDVTSKTFEGGVRGGFGGAVRGFGNAVADQAGIGDSVRRVQNAPLEAVKDAAAAAKGASQIAAGDYAGGITTLANAQIAQNSGVSSGGAAPSGGAKENNSAAFAAATKNPQLTSGQAAQMAAQHLRNAQDEKRIKIYGARGEVING